MKRRRHQHDEHDNSERWLLTYADLITLLLGLFVILYAMSKVDAAKYSELRAALGGIFGGEHPGMMTGKAGVMSGGLSVLEAERNRVAQEIRNALQGAGKSDLVTVSQNERGVTIHMMEQLLFTSGSADLKETSLATLDRLGELLVRLPNDIRVEGHTDNVPIHSDRFPSNWHLSVNRALNTAYYLMETHHFDPERLSVVGYSEYQPLVPNTSAENRARNRRVDIVIVTNVPHAATPAGNGSRGTLSTKGTP